MRRVLIITYYWPPSGGGGVQRWVKMSKYFRELGWDPIVFVPENPEYPIVDHSFDEEVKDIKTIKGKIWEPSRFLRKLGAKKEASLNAGFVTDSMGFKQRVAIAIRGNFFIPDARRFWIKPSVKTLSAYLKNNKIEAMISTGPPHSAHMIAYELKLKHNLPWIADFRDPWTNIDFYDDLKLSSWADKKHRQMERQVLETADTVVTIGKTMGEEMLELGAKKVEVITNGFDKKPSDIALDKDFTLTHIGRLGKSRNPKLLWDVLAEMVQEDNVFSSKCKVQLIGNVDGEIREYVERKGLSKIVTFGNNVSNVESLRIQSKSQVLLLLINDTPNAKGILTGKFFEYLSTNRPIVAIGPLDGDAAEILDETKSGEMFSYTDHDELKAHLLASFDQFLSGNLSANSVNIDKYHRKNLARTYITLLNSTVNG